MVSVCPQLEPKDFFYQESFFLLLIIVMPTIHAAPNVFSFPMLTPSFCQRLMEELEHFEQTDIPKGRPNTMNNSGVSPLITAVLFTTQKKKQNLHIIVA